MRAAVLLVAHADEREGHDLGARSLRDLLVAAVAAPVDMQARAVLAFRRYDANAASFGADLDVAHSPPSLFVSRTWASRSAHISTRSSNCRRSRNQSPRQMAAQMVRATVRKMAGPVMGAPDPVSSRPAHNASKGRSGSRQWRAPHPARYEDPESPAG